jgi:hypothetical protein
VGWTAGFIVFFVAGGRNMFWHEDFGGTGVSWEGEGAFLLANLWGAHGPPAVRPSILVTLLRLLSHFLNFYFVSICCFSK